LAKVFIPGLYDLVKKMIPVYGYAAQQAKHLLANTLLKEGIHAIMML